MYTYKIHIFFPKYPPIYLWYIQYIFDISDISVKSKYRYIRDYRYFLPWLQFKTMFWCYTINCEFSLMLIMIKMKKNRCVGYWKLRNIMGVNRIMSWKIVDVKIWFDFTSYASWLCEKKKKKNWRNGCVKWKWEWQDANEGKKEKK